MHQDLDVKKDSMRIGLVEDDIYVSPGEAAVAVPGVRTDGLQVRRVVPASLAFPAPPSARGTETRRLTWVISLRYRDLDD